MFFQVTLFIFLNQVLFIGVPSYEIIWEDRENCFKDLIPEKQLLEHVDLEKLWSTIEPQCLVDKAYPEIVEKYRQSKIKPKKVSKRKKKDAKIEEISDMMMKASISEPKAKKVRAKKVLGNKNENIKKTKTKKSQEDEVLKKLEDSFGELEITKPKQKVTTLDNFLKKAVTNSRKLDRTTPDIQKENIYETSTPSKQNASFDLSLLNFGDEDDLEVSDIIDDIISRKPKYIEENIRKLNLNLSEDDLVTNNVNSSSFFVTNPMENDLFERTFNLKDEDDSTDEYDLEENELQDEMEEENLSPVEKFKNNVEEGSDSFCDNYVPLYERLKKK